MRDSRKRKLNEKNTERKYNIDWLETMQRDFCDRKINKVLKNFAEKTLSISL